jgi:hypothetical protein
MDITQYSIEISRHALLRALERGITPDMVEATINGGLLLRFAKNNIRLVKCYKNFKVICIGEMIGNRIKIITIERGEK